MLRWLRTEEGAAAVHAAVAAAGGHCEPVPGRPDWGDDDLRLRLRSAFDPDLLFRGNDADPSE